MVRVRGGPQCCEGVCSGMPGWSALLLVLKLWAVGRAEGKGPEGVCGCRPSHTPGLLTQSPQRTAGKPQTSNLVTLAQKWLPGVLPGPFHPAPGPPSPQFGGYLFPLSQSRTILVCPNADRA